MLISNTLSHMQNKDKEVKRCAAIILSRFDSKRFPGKAMKLLAGKPLLSWSIEPFLNDPEIVPVVATTERKCDTPICNLAESLGVPVFRGHLENVAGRTLGAAREVNAKIFTRVNGDSPILRIELIKQALSILENTGYNFCTNLIPRAFPYGISVEMFKTEFFEKYYHRFTTDNHHEHITTFFYDDYFRHNTSTIAYPHGDDHDVRLVVDTPEDHAVLEKLLLGLEKDVHCRIKKIVDLYRLQRSNS